jgi:F0F1-type ATP synthase alpha subunit
VETELESKLGEQQQMQQLASISPTKFKTAFEELVNKLAVLNCGIEKIDSLLQLTSGNRLAIIGNRKYTQTLITRFCVNALLSSSSLSSKKRMNKREADFFTHPTL